MELTVLFEMTEDEARFVRDVMRYIGGSPDNTRRKHADRIQRSLSDALGAAPCPLPDMTGSIQCSNRPRTLSGPEQIKREEYQQAADAQAIMEEFFAECAECHGDCEACQQEEL